MIEIEVFKEKDNFLYFLNEIDEKHLLERLKEFCSVYNYEGFFNFKNPESMSALEGNINYGDLSLPFHIKNLDGKTGAGDDLDAFNEKWHHSPKAYMFMYGSRRENVHVIMTNLVKFLQSTYKKVAFSQFDDLIFFDEDLQKLVPVLD